MSKELSKKIGKIFFMNSKIKFLRIRKYKVSKILESILQKNWK